MSRLGRSNYGGKLTKGTTSERNAISSIFSFYSYFYSYF